MNTTAKTTALLRKFRGRALAIGAFLLTSCGVGASELPDIPDLGLSDLALDEPRAAGEVFRDCADCPEMVVVPAGSFTMGSPSSETMGLPSAEEYGYDYDFERPQHRVTIPRPFAVGVYEVTFAQWDACAAAGGCGGYRPGDEGWGRGDRPVIHVDWDDAQAYVRWLSGETGAEYRLLSEAEWEYAARAGTTTAYHTGRSISPGQANIEYNHGRTVPVGSFAANGFGLHDVHGNVLEWVEDCWNDGYVGAPSDGSAWERGDCSKRVLRGGSWSDGSGNRRSAIRRRVRHRTPQQPLRFSCCPDAYAVNRSLFTSSGVRGAKPPGRFRRRDAAS